MVGAVLPLDEADEKIEGEEAGLPTKGYLYARWPFPKKVV
jgi:hypothetical protein